MKAAEAYVQRAAASQNGGMEIDIAGGKPGPAITQEELERLRREKGLR